MLLRMLFELLRLNHEAAVDQFLCSTCKYSEINMTWAASWQNQQCGCAPSVDSDQPGHPPSLIRVFAVRMKKAWVLSYPLSAQWRLWSDWADAQADLSLRWAHTHFVGFVTRRLTWCYIKNRRLYMKGIMCTDIRLDILINVPRHDKTDKMSVRPAKTRISLGICPVWSESSLCAQWVAKVQRFLHADSEDSDQTGRMPRLIWVFAGRTVTLLAL